MVSYLFAYLRRGLYDPVYSSAFEDREIGTYQRASKSLANSILAFQSAGHNKFPGFLIVVLSLGVLFFGTMTFCGLNLTAILS